MKNNRSITTLSPLFQSTLDKETTHLILTSPSDEGVRRNFGRAGARFAPEAILNVTKKLNNHLDKSVKIVTKNVVHQELEKNNFEKAQAHSQSEIKNNLMNFNGNSIVHIGGGHDHIGPLLGAMDEMGYDKIIVINIDAHCDTRQDISAHSGTPFRDFSNKAKTKWSLYQFGIHDFANSAQTMEPLKSGNMKIVFRKDANSTSVKTLINEKVTKNSALVFSLDVDALESSVFEGVSAVNHNGLTIDQTTELLTDFFNLGFESKKVLGIYEYNPVYDNLSQKGSRALSNLLYEFLKIG